jgi:hypothetical protein
MKHGQDQTPFYIRTLEGDTFYVDSLDEAVANFVSEEGYRLTLRHTDGTEVILRRSAEPHKHDVLGNPIFDVEMTLRSETAKSTPPATRIN